MISQIVAVAKNRVIGKGNTLPWRLPDDMKFFKETTIGHHVVMGRKNYESIPAKFRPLPDRMNIILTRQKKYETIGGGRISSSIEEAIEFGKTCGKETFIIGGGEIYALAMPYTERLYITEINAEIDGDVFYPELDMSQWKEVSRVHHPIDEKHQYSFDFVIYDKIK